MWKKVEKRSRKSSRSSHTSQSINDTFHLSSANHVSVNRQLEKDNALRGSTPNVDRAKSVVAGGGVPSWCFDTRVQKTYYPFPSAEADVPLMRISDRPFAWGQFKNKKEQFTYTNNGVLTLKNDVEVYFHKKDKLFEQCIFSYMTTGLYKM